MYQMFHDGFVRPLSNANLIGLYLGAFIGVFGVGLLEVGVAVNIVELGLEELLSYMLSRVAGTNLIMMPFGFFLLQRLARRQAVHILWTLAAVASLGLLFFGPQLPFMVIGFATAVVVCPLWVMFHLSMMTHSSDENRGNELGVAHLWMTLGALFGSVCGGFGMTVFSLQAMLLIGIGAKSLATLVMFVYCRRSGVFDLKPEDDIHRRDRVSFARMVLDHPERSFATVISSMHAAAITGLWPIWLKMVGAGYVAVGLLNALKIGLKFVLSPIAGRLVNSGNGQDAPIGATLHIMGWMPWFMAITPMTGVFSSLFFATGTHLFEVGLQSRWYEQKSYECMAAREVLIAVGRLIGISVLLPLMFHMTEDFIIGASIMSVMLLASGILMSRSLQPQKRAVATQV